MRVGWYFDYGSKRDARIVKAEGRLCLVVCDLARDFGDILIEWATNICVVAEDERLFEIEANSDDISGIEPRKLFHLNDLELMLEQEFFIVCKGLVSGTEVYFIVN